MKIERLGSLKTALGECPQWHDGKLWMLDCRVGLLLALDPNSGQVLARHEIPAPVGSFAFNHDGKVILALKEHIASLDLSSGELRQLAHIGQSHPHLRLNDGISLPDGSFIVGTMHVFREEGEAPLGGLYRLDSQLHLNRNDTGYGVTNGPCVSPRDGRLYVADSEARCIHSYALAPDGSVADKRLFVNTSQYGSGPDGCCFDLEGGLWTALVRAGTLARFHPSGELGQLVEVPVQHPSALCFGGPEMKEMFVTSISDSGRLTASGPLDGAVLRISGTGFQGVARRLCRLPL